MTAAVVSAPAELIQAVNFAYVSHITVYYLHHDTSDPRAFDICEFVLFGALDQT
jgi:hypothetical protein